MAREETMITMMYCVRMLTALVVLTGLSDGSVIPGLNISALNTALAFGPYRELATSTTTTTKPGVQQQHQQNLLVSPLGLASALALLSRVSGSESRSQALEALGLAANSTEQRVEATMSALKELEQSLTMQEGGAGAGAQGAGSGVQGAGTGAQGAGSGVQGAGSGVQGAGSGVQGAGTGAQGAGSGVQGAGAQGTGTGVQGAGSGVQGAGSGVQGAGSGVQGAGSGVQGAGLGAEVQLKVWSSLLADSKPSLDYQSFLTHPQNIKPPTFNSTTFEMLKKDLQGSDKLVLTNYVHFKGQWEQPFEQRRTVPRSFQLNATASVEVPMMFRDDSAELRMLYDTVCSATVVRLPYSGRLASLLLLPTAALRPLEDCLSDSRMNFWLNNLKPGRAEIRIPKFRLRKSYSLDRLLRSSGVSSVFSDSADFSGVSPKKTLKLGKALHEVTLEVDETKSGHRGSSDVKLDFSVPPRITYDRPFIIVIYDELTGFIPLIGKIMDPRDI
ncbi:uncharacterized protein ACJ7VT_020966 [Polymixia lowei]